MESSLTISEIKRRGMAVINDRLRLGPAHIMKRNKQAAVILSEAQYQQLLGKDAAQMPGITAMQWLIAQSPVRQRSKAAIDADLQNERAW